MKLPTSQTATIPMKTNDRIWRGWMRGGRRARTLGSSEVCVDTGAASLNGCSHAYNQGARGGGGTGRLDALKRHCPSGRVGSNPTRRIRSLALRPAHVGVPGRCRRGADQQRDRLLVVVPDGAKE